MRSRAVVLAAALALAPPGARAADLVVSWDKGYYAQEDEAVAEMIAAFEHHAGKHVELALVPQEQLPGRIVAALAARHCPDVAIARIKQILAETNAAPRRLALGGAECGWYAGCLERLA